jgi:hypothetical protein
MPDPWSKERRAFLVANEIIEFPLKKEWARRKLEKILGAKLHHQDPEVLECMKRYLKDFLAEDKLFPRFKYALRLPEGTTEFQKAAIQESTKEMVDSFILVVMDSIALWGGEVLALHKRICELEKALV